MRRRPDRIPCRRAHGRNDREFLGRLRLNPDRPLIGSTCSGALILAALGLLDGRQATTYPTSVGTLRADRVDVIELPLVQQANVVTVAGRFAAQGMCGWVGGESRGDEARMAMLQTVQRVGDAMGG